MFYGRQDAAGCHFIGEIIGIYLIHRINSRTDCIIDGWQNNIYRMLFLTEFIERFIKSYFLLLPFLQVIHFQISISFALLITILSLSREVFIVWKEDVKVEVFCLQHSSTATDFQSVCMIMFTNFMLENGSQRICQNMKLTR